MEFRGSGTKRRRVVEAIAGRIRSGELTTGDRLSTVRDLAAHFDSSLTVVQSAMRELVGNGMVECRGREGFYVRAPAVEEPARTAPPDAAQDPGPARLCCHHHSDLIWRRSYTGYREVRARQIDLLLSLFSRHPEFQCFFDQSEVVENYLEDRPAQAAAFKQRVAEGGIELVGGMSIPDLNLCGGESLIRNLRFGREFYQRVFGVTPSIASMTDAFGMCAQLPQVLLLAGYKTLIPGRMPNLPPDIPDNRPFRWRGLDGSILRVAPFTGLAHHGGYLFNVPVTWKQPDAQLARTLAAAKRLSGAAMICYMTEEDPICEDLFRVLEAANRAGGRTLEFGRVRDFCDPLEAPPAPMAEGEWNPVFTGCYTTRIGIKQRVRAAESKLADAEFMAALANRSANFDPLWRDLIRTQFHDAVCGCHTDEAAAAIEEKLSGVLSGCDSIVAAAAEELAGGGIAIFNPDHLSGPALVSCELPRDLSPKGVASQRDGDRVVFVHDLPPCGMCGLPVQRKRVPASRRIAKPKRHRLETDFFDVSFDGADPVIRSRTGKRSVFAERGFGEIRFRADFGSMWVEALESDYVGAEFQSSEIVEVEEGGVFIRVVTAGHVLPGPREPGNIGSFWPGFGALSFRKEYRFPRHLDSFRLRIVLDWKGSNTKIVARFPLALDGPDAVATYEVPFGALARRPYYEVPSEQEASLLPVAPGVLAHAKGDWPALAWVDVADRTGGLSMANTGTPGHQIKSGEILVSLLRSPTRRADGGLVPQPGAQDEGTHAYDFSFRPRRPEEMEKAVELGRRLNRPPISVYSARKTGSQKPFSMVRWDAGNIALSALKRGAGDASWILRLYETLGRKTTVWLRSDRGPLDVAVTDVAEQAVTPVNPARLIFRPFEIKTLRVTPESVPKDGGAASKRKPPERKE